MVNDKNKDEIQIQRTDNNKRKRPDAHHRHGNNILNRSSTNLKLVDIRDFEWLAWNYRTYKIGIKFESEKDMVAQMLN